MTSAIASASNRENRTRCNVWQLTQPANCCFCCCVPGTDIRISPFDICSATLVGLVILLSCRSTCAPCAVTSADVLGNSYPTARMLMLYLPGVTRSRGKLYSPCALLTTHVVTVEPSFFAPIRTPSMLPSASDMTLPDSAGAG